MASHNTSPLRQQLLRSIAREGRHMRLVVSNDSPSETIAVGPLRSPTKGDAA